LIVDFSNLSLDFLHLTRPAHVVVKDGYLRKSADFCVIRLSSMKTLADRHRRAAYHNKNWWQAFQWYQHEWLWMTLNSKNRDFSDFCDFWLRKSELRQNGWTNWTYTEITCEQELLLALAHLMSISSDFLFV